MTKKETKPKPLTLEEIDIFEKVQSQLESLHSEIGALSKKAQNDAINKFKLKFINQVLGDANNILGEKYKPFFDFDLFDENELPTNSDVTFIVSQYLGCIEKLKVDNTNSKFGTWHWNNTNIKTNPPQKFRR